MNNLNKDHTAFNRNKLRGTVGGSRTKVCEICYGTTFESYGGNLKCKKCGQIYYI